MTSTLGTYTGLRFPTWAVALLAAATFGVGLVAGLDIPRTASTAIVGQAVTGSTAVAAVATGADASRAWLAYRSGERGLPAFNGALGAADAAAAFRSYRIGERDLGTVVDAAAAFQSYRTGERDLGTTLDAAAAFQSYRAGERDLR